MRTSYFGSFVWLAGFITGSSFLFAQQPDEALTVSHCVISTIDEAQIPVRKPGVICHYAVCEGDVVKAGDPLVQLDDAESRAQRHAAETQLEVANKRAENDIDVRYARAAALVARAELQAAEAANRRVASAVPPSDLRQLQLAENRATLGIEQAQVQFTLAGLETRIAEAQLAASQLDVALRQVVSPIDGNVVRLYRHVGEWCDLGQPVCHVVSLKRMRVTGFVNVKDYEQSEMLGRDVTVTVTLANGSIEKFSGKLGFASPIIQAGGE